MAIDPIQKFPPLYKKDSKGKIRVWSMELGQGDTPDSGYHRTIAGIEGGKMVTSGWTECQPKNVGKSNETTALTQAASEIESAYEKKLELTYFRSKDEIDTVRYIEPMLAQDYTKVRSKIEVTDGVYAQPKLDGIRCIARADGLWTRKGKQIVACPHIEEALAPFFKKNPEAVLDGELYNHYFADDFNKITSIVRKTKPTEADLSRSKQYMLYHIYDWVSEKPFDQRIRGVSDVVVMLDSPYLMPVDTVLVHRQSDLDQLYGNWIAEGYEGQMVRPNDGEGYQPGKRSRSLLKRKEFQTDEFPVLRMEEGNGNWAGAVKKFIVKLPNGNECDATPRGSYDDQKAMLEKGDVPTWATVRYFGYTPDGYLRFPVAVDWGFGEGRTD